MQSDSLQAKATKLTLSTSLLLRPDQISFKPIGLLLLNFFVKSKLHTYRCVRVCAVLLSRSERNQTYPFDFLIMTTISDVFKTFPSSPFTLFHKKLNWIHTNMQGCKQSDCLDGKATKRTILTFSLWRPDLISLKPSNLSLLHSFLKPKLHTCRCVRVCAVWLSRSESNQPQHHAGVLRRHMISKLHVIPLNKKS